MTTNLNVPNINVTTNSDDSDNRSGILSLPRRSMESIFSTSNTTITNTGNGRFPFNLDARSGSIDYSPLGNNSIFELVMNTRRRDWLRPPTTIDIPTVQLSKETVDSNWRNLVDEYVESITSEEATFKKRNDIKIVFQMEKVKQINDNQDDEDENNILERDEIRLVNDIPKFYFEKDFQLDNGRIFDKVLNSVELELSDLISQDEAKRNENHVQLKDKLNDYLDAVESLLVFDIAKTSHKFFDALKDVDDIQKNAISTKNDLEDLSKTLSKIDEQNIKGKMENVQLMIKRQNVEKLEQGLLQVKLINEKVELCKKLMDEKNYDECMSLIKTVEHLILGNTEEDTVKKWTLDWPYQLSNLKSVPALVDAREFLTNMKIEIGGKYSIQLSNLLLDDLRSSYEDININETLKQLQNGYPEKQRFSFPNEFQDSVKELIIKLKNCEELASSFKFYQEKATTEVKSIIKKYLPNETLKKSQSTVSFMSDKTASETSRNGSSINIDKKLDTGGSSLKLSNLIKEMTPLEFQEMIIIILANCIEALKKLYRQQKLLLDISLREINMSSMPSENQHNMITQLDIRPGLNEIIRIVQLRIGKIITVRKELTSAVKPEYFLKLYSICVLFIQESESLSGEYLTKYLSNVLESQIKNYITVHDTRNIRSIQKKIEIENWVPFIVNPSVQKDVNDIISSIDIDPIDWFNFLKLEITDQDNVSGNSITGSGDTTGDAGDDDTSTDISISDKPKGNRKSVVLGDKTFVASDSLLTVIEIIKELFVLSLSLPTMYLRYFERMCFNILKHFNTYTLRSITKPDGTLTKKGKNLSIMGESIDCLTEFIDYLQRFYQRLSLSAKDFTPFKPAHYVSLVTAYRDTSAKLYATHAPPPPPPM